MIRDLRPDEVEFSLIQHPENMDYTRDNYTGDANTDDEVVEWIRDQLNSGNDWAWCQIEVKATWQGFTGSDYLGGCSYESEEDFKAVGGYWGDMKLEALASLNTHLKEEDFILEKLRVGQ